MYMCVRGVNYVPVYDRTVSGHEFVLEISIMPLVLRFLNYILYVTNKVVFLFSKLSPMAKTCRI